MSTWTSLPQELALLVSQRLSTADVLQARGACRDWRCAFQHAQASLVPLTLDAELLDSFPGAAGLDLLSRSASRRLTPDSISLLASFRHLASLRISGATLTDGLVEQLLNAVQRCTGLEALVLRQVSVNDSQRTVPATLAAVASLPRLRQLKLHCLWLPTMSFMAFRSCMMLHELTLEGLNSLEDNDVALQSLCEACPCLRKLRLQPHGQWLLRTYRPLARLKDLSDVLLNDVKTGDAAFEDIGNGCPHLTKLDLMDCGMISASQGMQLSHLRALRCLRIWCHHSTYRAFMHLSCLERLDMFRVDCTGGNPCLITQLSEGPAAHTLKQLSLPACASDKRGLASLAAFTALQALNLSCARFNWLEDLGVALAGLHLTYLDLSYWASLPDSALAHLSKLTKLKFLSLEAPPGRHSSSVSEAGLAGLSRLQLLGHLDLSGRPVSNVHLPHIAGCARLKRLLLGSASVSDQGLLALSGLSILNTLVLDRTHINGSCLRQLPTCLRDLRLSHCRSTMPTALTHMTRFCSLRALSLNGCAGVTDDVLTACATSLTALSALDLTACKQVTARGLVSLAGMTSLITLNLVCACANMSLEAIKESLSASSADVQYPAGHYSAHVSPAVQRLKRTQAQRSPCLSKGSSQGQSAGMKPRKLF